MECSCCGVDARTHECHSCHREACEDCLVRCEEHDRMRPTLCTACAQDCGDFKMCLKAYVAYQMEQMGDEPDTAVNLGVRR